MKKDFSENLFKFSDWIFFHFDEEFSGKPRAVGDSDFFSNAFYREDETVEMFQSSSIRERFRKTGTSF